MRTAKVLQSTGKVFVWTGRVIITRFATVSFAA
jgi:hypothetical protein